MHLLKTEFRSRHGHEGMKVDCDAYTVEFYKTTTRYYQSQVISFFNKKTKITYPLVSWFRIEWDDEKDGGRLEIKHRDQWGSEMIFKHYDPSDLKGMFDFIAKGYNLYEKISQE